MFVNPSGFACHLKALAIVILKRLPSSRNAVAAFQEEDPDNFIDRKYFASINEALTRLEKIMRFIGSTLCKPTEAHGLDLNPADDSVWMATYSGKLQLEKGLSEIVQKSPHWSKSVDEIARTAASSMRLRPERDRVLESLQNIGNGTLQITSEKLEEFNKIFPDFHTGMRACDIEDINMLMITEITKLVNGLLRDEMEIAQGSKLVHALLKSLKVFSMWPGMTEKSKEVEAWMTKHQQDIALVSLLEASKQFESSGVADLTTVQEVMSRLQKVVISQDQPEYIRAARTLLNTAFRGVIKEAEIVRTVSHC